MRALPKGIARALYVAFLLLFLEGSSRFVLSRESLLGRILGNDAASFRIAWIHRGPLPGVAYTFDAYHPIRGWTLLPSIREALVFGDRILNSNSKGLRGRREFPYERSKGVPRVEIFGDSFTFGEEVSDGETYAAALERHLPGVEVLNMGEHGYGHDQMLLYLEDEGLRYRPDVVVLGFHPFDMERNLLSFRDFAKPRFDLERDGLVLRDTPVPTPEVVRAAEPYRSKFWDLLTMLFARSQWISGRNDVAMKEITGRILRRFGDLSTAHSFRLLLAYLPVWHELDPGPPTDGERFFLSYCERTGTECVDLRPSFLEREAAGDHFKTSGHWNRREHEAAAEFLAPRLRILLQAQGALPEGR